MEKDLPAAQGLLGQARTFYKLGQLCSHDSLLWRSNSVRIDDLLDQEQIIGQAGATIAAFSEDSFLWTMPGTEDKLVYRVPENVQVSCEYFSSTYEEVHARSKAETD